MSVQQTNHSIKRRINILHSILIEFVFSGESGPVNVGAIVGGVIGAILFLLIIVLLVIFGRQLYPTLKANQRKKEQKVKVN